MRCTKCHYLSFEPEPRCKNCGHDLSIDELALPLELSQPGPEPAGDPLGDFRLDLGGSSGGVAVLERPAVAAVAAATAVAPVAATPAPVAAAPMTAELPLFVRDLIPDDDDEDLAPLVKVPPRPRPPLAVRRPTPDPVKLRARYAPAEPEPDLWTTAAETSIRTEAAPAVEPVHVAESSQALPVPMVPAVPRGTRIAAAAIDAAVLGSIAAVVVVFTMQLAQLPLAQVTVLPLIPLFGFFALIGVGYELMFTAYNGQTIGKMLMGLKVVSSEDDRVSLRQAALRAVSMLPLGAGLLAAFVGPGLAVHDRLSHTRVVRA